MLLEYPEGFIYQSGFHDFGAPNMKFLEPFRRGSEDGRRFKRVVKSPAPADNRCIDSGQ